MPRKNFNHFLVLPHLKFSHYETEKRFIYIHCESSQRRPECKFCGAEKPFIHQHQTRRLKDSVVRGKIHVLIVKSKRYRCRKCHKTFNYQHAVLNDVQLAV